MVKKLRSLINNRLLAGVFIFIFAFLVYSPSLNNDFVWDDLVVIKKQYYRYQEYDFLSIFLSGITTQHTYYRPIHQLSYATDYFLWGENPHGFHLSNVLLFSITSVLVYSLILLILKEFHVQSKEYIALLGSVYFVIHPMHVESVSWIAGRTDILCGLFFVAAFIFHIRSLHNRIYLLLAAPLLFCSLLSKEVAATFPFVVILYHLIDSKRIDRKRLSYILLYTAILCLYLFLRSGILDNTPVLSEQVTGNGGGAVKAGMFYKYLSAVKVMLCAYVYYFFKLLFPFKFNSFITNVPTSLYVTAASILSFIGIFYLWLRSVTKGNGILGFSLGWIVLTLGPSVLVAVFSIATTPLAERYLFIPSVGMALAAGYLFIKFINIKGFRKPAFILIGLFLFIHLYLTIERQSVWNDGIAFWKTASAETTDNIIPLINYGMILIEKGDTDLGMKKLETALNSDKKGDSELKSVAANNLGIGYLNKGDTQNAEYWFEKAVSYNPGFYKSYYHLAIIHYGRSRYHDSTRELKSAERLLYKAIDLYPDYARAYFMLANINMDYGNVDTAKKFAQQAIDIGLERPLAQQARRIINLK